MKNITVLALALITFASANAQTSQFTVGGQELAKATRPLTATEFSNFRPMDISSVPVANWKGFALLKDRGIDGDASPKISLVVSEGGYYLARGQYCNSSVATLGTPVLSSFYFQPGDFVKVRKLTLLDDGRIREATPDAPSICYVEVQHFGVLGLEIKWMGVFENRRSDLNVVGETILFDGSYQIFVSSQGDLTTGAKAYLGGYAISENIRTSTSGVFTITFPKGIDWRTGSTSLVIASANGDKVTSYDRKMTPLQ